MNKIIWVDDYSFKMDDGKGIIIRGIKSVNKVGRENKRHTMDTNFHHYNDLSLTGVGLKGSAIYLERVHKHNRVCKRLTGSYKERNTSIP